MYRSLFLYLLFTTPLISWAFQLTPMTYSFSVNNSTHYFTLTNNSDQPEAIELTMAKREMDEQGKERHPIIDDLFLIFPDQLILQPKQRRKIKVQLLKTTPPNIEGAYRLIAEQLPINLNTKKPKGVSSNINILLRYIASIYIEPKKEIHSYQIINTQKKQNQLLIVLKNSGTTHLLLRNLKIKLSDGQHHYQYPKKELKGMAGENILAGKRRIFHLPFPSIISNNFKVDLKFE